MRTKQISTGVFAFLGIWFAGGLVVHAQVALTPSTLPDGTVGIPYSETIAVSSSTGSFAWTLSGNLPPGLSFDTMTYNPSTVLSGTPTSAGTNYTFTINASGNGAINTQTYTMSIDTNSNPTSTTNMNSTAVIEAELVNAETELVALEAALSATAPAPNSAPVFARDLTIGNVGADVMALQKYLNQNGYPLASSGPGSVGEETDYFGPLTQAALAKWQAANGVSPAQGYYGPITRGMIGSSLP